MVKRTLVSIAVALSVCGWVSLAFGQNAAEYAGVAGASTAAAAGAHAALSSRTKDLPGRVQTKLGAPVGNSMEENRKKLEEKSREGGATVHIKSKPEKATVFVDGFPVAYTPADLKVGEGKHVVKVTLSGFVAWSKEVAVARGADVSLSAELENMYKSVVTLSKPK